MSVSLGLITGRGGIGASRSLFVRVSRSFEALSCATRTSWAVAPGDMYPKTLSRASLSLRSLRLKRGGVLNAAVVAGSMVCEIAGNEGCWLPQETSYILKRSSLF